MINEQFIHEHTLKECLEAFKGARSNGTESRLDSVTKEFQLLARKFLFGGFIRVGDTYDIYLRNIEFYYHEEVKSEDQIKDPMVYHRNGKFPGKKLPPFPLMSIHVHWSGFDIAFEDPAGNYRASVLVRDYIVIEHKESEERGYVRLQTAKLLPENRVDEDGWRIEGYNEVVPEPFVMHNPLYLHYYLNGFSMDGSPSQIRWEEIPNAQLGMPKSYYRKRVYNDPQKSDPDKRMWAFYRDDQLPNIG